ncbi:FMN reductase [Dictyobacter alpinus]|uniref:FMN reductase n=1 Tax=Dictyobacter alpinus TaxID=2014873 RepID=A0A402BJN8_9CHLR|nr:NAD(P)H-dependent oxidoreductase [Dictyobacter alpinus]GCE31553.1 FMN reductase [Dictyobacter alpinus]
MIKLAIIIGSTRQKRKGEVIARWVREIAASHSEVEAELVDLKDFKLPHLGEEVSTEMEPHNQANLQAWSEKIASFDAYIFVTPEYNHGPSGVLKNAIDHLYSEWNNKAAGFVGYGYIGGARAVEHLRLVMGEIQVADVKGQVAISLSSDFEDYTLFQPRSFQGEAVNTMLDQLIAWGGALKTLRATPVAN